MGTHQQAAIGRIVHRVAGALGHRAKAPVLPYAHLWEASVVVGLLTNPQYFEPDRYAIDTPFLPDSWPRG